MNTRANMHVFVYVSAFPNGFVPNDFDVCLFDFTSFFFICFPYRCQISIAFISITQKFEFRSKQTTPFHFQFIVFFLWFSLTLIKANIRFEIAFFGSHKISHFYSILFQPKWKTSVAIN